MGAREQTSERASGEGDEKRCDIANGSALRVTRRYGLWQVTYRVSIGKERKKEKKNGILFYSFLPALVPRDVSRSPSQSISCVMRDRRSNRERLPMRLRYETGPMLSRVESNCNPRRTRVSFRLRAEFRERRVRYLRIIAR